MERGAASANLSVWDQKIPQQVIHPIVSPLALYFRSSLIAHLDKPWSHVISAILNIGQEVDEDWPLFIKDHEDKSHKVLLRRGEMLW